MTNMACPKCRYKYQSHLESIQHYCDQAPPVGYRAALALDALEGEVASLRATRECLWREIDVYREALGKIAKEDYRGNRPQSIDVAEAALAKYPRP